MLAYTLHDLGHVAVGALLLGPLVSLLPGAAIGWHFDILGFRRRSVGLAACLSIVLSVAALPSLLWAADRLAGRPGCVALVAALAVLSAPCLREWLRRARAGSEPGGRRRIGWIAAGLGLLVVLSLVDVGIGRRLLGSYAQTDHAKHVAVIASLAQYRCPPANPFYVPGEPAGLCYYYQWHLLGATIESLGFGWLSAIDARTASAAWATVALCALVLVYLRFRRAAPPSHIVRRATWGLGLLLVGGIDLLPWLALAARGRLLKDVDWWNEQIAMWVGQMVWVPQHLGSLVAAATGILLLRRGLDAEAPKRARLLAAALAGLALASSAGMSVYVFLTSAASLLVWAGLVLLRRRRRAPLLAWAVTVAVAAAFVLPFAAELAPVRPFEGVGLRVEVRRFYPLRDALTSAGIPDSAPVASALHLDALPLSYGLELGFFGLAAVWCFARRRRAGAPIAADADLVSELCLVAVPLAVGSFVCSSVENNDLGWRGLMPMQLVLLASGVGFLEALREGAVRSRALRTTAVVLLAVGVLGSGVDLLSLRLTQAVRAYSRPSEQVGEDLASARAACEWVRDHTAPDAVLALAGDPPDSGATRAPRRERCLASLYSDRLLAAGDRVNLRSFCPPDPPVAADVDRIFATASWDEALALARRWRIGVLIADASSPVWEDRASWVWTRPADFEAPRHRVFLTALR